MLVTAASKRWIAADGRRTKVARLARIDPPYLLDVLCRSVRWRRLDRRRNAELRVDPPTAVAQVILHRHGEWRFPAVVGVITTRGPDGSLPGYDLKTRLILVDPPRCPRYPETRAE